MDVYQSDLRGPANDLWRRVPAAGCRRERALAEVHGPECAAGRQLVLRPATSRAGSVEATAPERLGEHDGGSAASSRPGQTQHCRQASTSAQFVAAARLL